MTALEINAFASSRFVDAERQRERHSQMEHQTLTAMTSHAVVFLLLVH